MGSQTDAMLRISIAYCVYQIAISWGKLVVPFMIWDLEPQPTFFQIGLISSLGNLFALIGSLLCGNFYDSAGTRFVSLICTVLSGIYILFASQTHALWMMYLIQVMRVAFNYPQVVEANVGGLYGNDDKQRVRALVWLTIPNGLGLVLGPYFAGVAFRWMNFDLRLSYALSAVLFIVILLPIVIFVVPEPRSSSSRFYSEGGFAVYGRLMRYTKLKKTLIFKLFLELPFTAFDEMARTYLVHFLIDSPSDMSVIAVAVGVTTLLINGLCMRPLQQNFTAQRLLQVAFVILSFSYFLLSYAAEYWWLLLSMPIQMVGYSIGSATLCAQAIGSVDSADIGKAVGLMSSVQQIGLVLLPLASAWTMGTLGYPTVCIIAMITSMVAVGAVQLMGNFMRQSNNDYLPGFS